MTARGIRPLLLCLLLVGCTHAGNLKPGVPRGTLEDGFDKTTEGLSLTVRGRHVNEVWNAVTRGTKTILDANSRIVIIEEQQLSRLKLEGKDFLGWFPNYYVGIWMKPVDQGYVVEVSKINWSRTQPGEYGPSEGDYLRAIQRELAR